MNGAHNIAEKEGAPSKSSAELQDDCRFELLQDLLVVPLIYGRFVCNNATPLGLELYARIIPPLVIVLGQVRQLVVQV